MYKSSIKVFEAVNFIKAELKVIYPPGEIRAITELIFEHLLNFSKTDLLLNYDTKLSNSHFNKIVQFTRELAINKPIQYVLGEAWFYGLKLKVTPDVLIPRQETEELVKWIVEETLEDGVKVADLGTGSGCIAIALALNLSDPHITAIDNSPSAIEVAKENNIKHGAGVNLIIDDIFNPIAIKSRKYNIIVSNPPYVTEAEKEFLNANVINNEPATALFVSDNQAIKYYEAIAGLAKSTLNTKGKLFFEINETKATEIYNLLMGYGFNNIEIRKDINGKERMIRALLS